MTITEPQKCECGYERKDKSNWCRHRKSCKVAKAVTPLKVEAGRMSSKQEDFATYNASLHMLHSQLRTMQEEQKRLTSTVSEIQKQLQAIVPSRTTINNTVNNTVHIHIYPFGSTPLPLRRDVIAILRDPSSSLPAYFGLKHMSDPKRRNVKLITVDGTTKISIYKKDMRTGLLGWKAYDRKQTLETLVNGCLDDLNHKFEAPNSTVWGNWRRWAADEGLRGYRDPEKYEAFQSAECEIERMLIERVE